MARVSIQGKVTSKKISTWLKSTFGRNSILAITPPEDGLTQPEDSQDHHLEQDHSHDADGYLSDSSYISQGDITEPYLTSIKTRRPLRRAISLEDLATASAIHHQLHTSGLLRNSRQRRQQSGSSPPHHSNALLADAFERPASSASIYHRRQQSLTGAQEHKSSFIPLTDRPHTAMSVHNDEFSYKHDDHNSLPTPDVSPEELSESSDELVIIQGELLEEARMARSVDRIRPSQSYFSSFDGLSAGTDASTIRDDPLSGEVAVRPWSWLTESPFIDALVNWIEGPEGPVQQKSQDKDKPNPWLEIPLQFIALLTYPEPDPKNGNKMTLAMVRETSFVRQRRRTLLMLTAFTLVVRYCSFDFFIVVLFASNCAMLFLMKNSGRMNVNMAKRAVRQRVGWAKQWAGSIFRRGGNNHNSGGNNNNQQGSFSNPQGPNANAYSPSVSEFARPQQTSPVIGESAAGTITAENSPQMKRRGLFGKRKTVDNATQLHSSATSTHGTLVSAEHSVHGNHTPPMGDGASMVSGAPTASSVTTSKRRFFRRNNTSNNTGNACSSSSPSLVAQVPVVAPAPVVAPVPMLARASTSSSASHGTSRLTAMNTPHSSSPLAQSQSLPHLQFSPQKSFSPPPPPPAVNETVADQAEAKWLRKTRSNASTPPPPALISHSRSHSHSNAAPVAADVTGEPIGVSIHVRTLAAAENASAAPQKVSELSQLLGQYRVSSSVPAAAAAATTKEPDAERSSCEEGLAEERGQGRNSGDSGSSAKSDGDVMETSLTTTTTTTTMDAVTSAAADAMEDL
ncbi:hypothetical protein BGZ54_006831 [Gamsiella multidivaricata]|nr:hypothetical protein BGZ54_006831 [Gamsiella multidivaricata]